MAINLKPNNEWMASYQELVNFKETHGHLFVPYKEGKRTKLNSWISLQRINLKKNKLSAKQIKLLDQIGFKQTQVSLRLKNKYLLSLNLKPSSKWMVSYQELVNFKKKHGHLFVPYKEGKRAKLNSWLSVQRVRLKQKRLSAQQIELLDKIGFRSPCIVKTWMDNYQHLLAYKQKYGHINVTRTSTVPKNLYDWVSKQRESFAQKKLSVEQIKLLEKAGFVWSIHSALWKENYLSLLAFKKVHRRINISRTENMRLNNWIVNQRIKRRQNKLSDEQINLLDKMGFVWDNAKITDLPT